MMLTDDHKETRKKVCSELSAQYEDGEDDFLIRTITNDETWLHHFEPETKDNQRNAIMQTHQRIRKKNSKLRLQHEKLWLLQ